MIDDPQDDPPDHRDGDTTDTGATSQALVARSSAIVRELLKQPPRTRIAIGAADELLIILDAVIAAANLLMDKTDTRDWTVKVEAVIEEFQDIGATHGPRIADFITNTDEKAIEAWARRLASQNFVSFLERLLGAGAFHRLHVAMSEDFDVLASLVYRNVDRLMPVAQALADVTAGLTEEQIRQIVDFNPAGSLLLEMVLGIYDVIDLAAEKIALPEHLERLPEIRQAKPSAGDLVELSRQMRGLVSDSSRELVGALSTVLDRKLRGARDALAFSADSTSQCANSLIEFIDRFVHAVCQNEAVAWLDRNYAGTTELTYVDSRTSVVRATTRGQLLAAMHGLEDVHPDGSPMHLLVAASMAETRRTLQRLKHSDSNTPEELAELDECIVRVEAFIELGIKIAWMGLSDEKLTELQRRLDPDKAAAMATAETVSVTAS